MGVPKTPDRACDWLSRVSKTGHVNAAIKLAEHFRRGRHDEVAEYWALAARNALATGDLRLRPLAGECLYELSVLVRSGAVTKNEYGNENELLKAAADMGFAWASFAFGQVCLDAEAGLDKQLWASAYLHDAANGGVKQASEKIRALSLSLSTTAADGAHCTDRDQDPRRLRPPPNIQPRR